MDVLVDYQGPWGIGDALCSDPMMLGLTERYGPGTRIWVRGYYGNVLHNPLVAGEYVEGQPIDHTVEVKLFHLMEPSEYAKLEAMPSLIDHMCSYANVTPSDRRPKLYLTAEDLLVLRRIPLLGKPRIVICADYIDPLRHWPAENWLEVAHTLREAGAQVIEVGRSHRLGVGTDLVGQLSVRQTAAVMSACNLFVGNNSGLFHYAQAAELPCVTLFSLATPSRFVHPGARVYPVEATDLDCLHCMTRDFVATKATGCTAQPRGRCMTEIPVSQVLDVIDAALNDLQPASRAEPAGAAP